MFLIGSSGSAGPADPDLPRVSESGGAPRPNDNRGGQGDGSGKPSPSHQPRSILATAAVSAGEAQSVRVCVFV